MNLIQCRRYGVAPEVLKKVMISNRRSRKVEKTWKYYGSRSERGK